MDDKYRMETRERAEAWAVAHGHKSPGKPGSKQHWKNGLFWDHYTCKCCGGEVGAGVETAAETDGFDGDPIMRSAVYFDPLGYNAGLRGAGKMVMTPRQRKIRIIQDFTVKLKPPPVPIEPERVTPVYQFDPSVGF